MNLQNFQILADRIRANPGHFNLKHWYSSGQDGHRTEPGEELPIVNQQLVFVVG